MNYELETLFPEVLSTTRDIELFMQCPYKWFIYRCQRMSKYIYNNDLAAGKDFAKAMEVTRTAYYKSGFSQDIAVEMGKKVLLEDFGAAYNEAEYQDKLKTPEKMVEVFERMWHEHPLDESAIVPFEMGNGELSVEQQFDVELPFIHPETGKPLILKCLLDMLGIKDNTVFVVDEKTTKSVLNDDAKQADLLRTQNQTVQYVTVANMNKESFGNLNVTHVCLNKCVVKNKYAEGEEVVHAYEFLVDVWFQKTWWNNLLFIVRDMLEKYQIYSKCKVDPTYELQNEVIFPRAYGTACNVFYKPCSLTYHCTSGNAQDLFEQGFKQIVCDSRTNYEEVPLKQYKRKLLGE